MDERIVNNSSNISPDAIITLGSLCKQLNIVDSSVGPGIRIVAVGHRGVVINIENCLFIGDGTVIIEGIPNDVFEVTIKDSIFTEFSGTIRGLRNASKLKVSGLVFIDMRKSSITNVDGLEIEHGSGFLEVEQNKDELWELLLD